MDLESHLLRLSIALLRIDSHDINLHFSYRGFSHRLEAGSSGMNSGLDVPLLGRDGHRLAEVTVHVQSLVRGPDWGPVGATALSLGPGLIHGLGLPLVHRLGLLVVILKVVLEHLGLWSELLEPAGLGLREDRGLLLLRPHLRPLLGGRGPEAPVLRSGAQPPL